MQESLPHPAEVMRGVFARLARNGKRELGFEHAHAADMQAWQDQLRRKLMWMLGVNDHEPHEVRGELVGSEQADGFDRQLVRIQGRDGAVIPAYWLVPHGLRGPAPVMVALHGHGPGKAVPAGASQDPQRGELQIIGERDYAAQAARRGYLCLVPDLRGFGEMTLPEALLAHRPSTCVEMSMRAIAAGRSLVGMRVRDLMSCVDWVVAQPDVDPARIACSGQSGGGTYSVWTAALDERIAATAPCCGFCTFEHAIMSVHHCPCNYVPGVLDVCEYYDLAGLIAPRALLVIAGAMDPIFPLEGVRVAFDKTRQIYAAAGALDRVRMFVGAEGHRYYAQPLWPFLNEFLGTPARS